MTWLTCLLAVMLFMAVVNKRFAVQFTSICSAWRWALAAASCLTVAAFCRILPGIGTQVQSLLQYSAAVLSLAPFVDVLGARRPAHKAWPWFVILPMILILHWPAISQFAALNAGSPIEIPTPTFLGFLFVMLMGCGNYFGTDNLPSAFLAALGIICTAIPVSEWGNFSNAWMFPFGVLFLLGAVTLAVGGRRNVAAEPQSSRDHAALWTDFCSLYGMVWAKRVMDRINQFAERESWTVRMSAFGFVAHPNEPPAGQMPEIVADVDDRPLLILTWVLRRFLDYEFLSSYLPTTVISRETIGGE